MDGAVTNARSLMEAILLEIEVGLDPDAPEYNGDLPKLYKRVQRLLGLDPSRPEVETAMKQVSSGLASRVTGLAGMSNKMGDRHARTYNPGKHHAQLAVNAAKTVSSFLYETFRARTKTSSV